MTGPYDDILHLPHPDPARHPRMPRRDRAAQFSPFAALTGYAGAIQETARLTCERAELSEDRKAVLDLRLRLAAESGLETALTYFLPDSKKDGGAYRTVTGVIKTLDELRHTVVLTDGTRIPIEDITEVEGEAPQFVLD